ncbi:hypothetical protein HS7_20120 [Sulfolobales archaeon HS-7]|nr:hypothetical protein HS7_20120 [Sulfolobales archaeon HS-7]
MVSDFPLDKVKRVIVKLIPYLCASPLWKIAVPSMPVAGEVVVIDIDTEILLLSLKESKCPDLGVRETGTTTLSLI